MALRPTDTPGQAEQDATNTRNNGALQALIQQVNAGVRDPRSLTPGEQSLLETYGYKIGETGQVEHKSWWDINKWAVIAPAAVVGGGLAAGAFGGGAAGAGAGGAGGGGAGAAGAGAAGAGGAHTAASLLGGYGGLISTGAQIASNLYGAHIQAKASTHAADLQAKAAAEALAFTKQQAAQTQTNFETTQHANYDQWAARQGNVSNLGQLMGLPARTIPAYVPTTTVPSAATPSAAPRTAPASTTGTVGALTGPGTPSLPSTAQQAPQIGQTKTFPNGATGLWDGRGWVAQ